MPATLCKWGGSCAVSSLPVVAGLIENDSAAVIGAIRLGNPAPGEESPGSLPMPPVLRPSPGRGGASMGNPSPPPPGLSRDLGSPEYSTRLPGAEER